MAEIVRRRSWGGVFPLGRHVSISGSSLIQCASVSIALSSFQDGQNAIPVRRFQAEQALIPTCAKDDSFRVSKPVRGRMGQCMALSADWYNDLAWKTVAGVG